MLLTEKGPIQPPPTLEGYCQEVSLTVQSWPRIISATHWSLYDRTQVDGADFHVDEAELGHIHLNGEIHLLLTKPLRDLLIAQEVAHPFRWSDEWIVMTIECEEDVIQATRLFQLGYDRLCGSSDAEICSRILSDMVECKT